ncbi:hypothetical protein EBB07_31770 [Paenibacillaceae bacterium]|nr:hypothetical protein EBB07_31770 [Paenibacillaceae bacterium]
MNEGYIAIWIIVVASVLMATGWRTMVTGNLSLRELMVFGTGALALYGIPIPIGSLAIGLSALWAVLWAVTLLIQSQNGYKAVNLFTGSILLAVVLFWIRQMYLLDPVFIIVHPQFDAALAAGLCTGLMALRIKEQFILLVLAFAGAEAFLQLLHGTTGQVQIGGAAWWDNLLFALLCAKLSGGAVQAADRILLRRNELKRLKSVQLSEREGHLS